jgi:hypothetical protein
MFSLALRALPKSTTGLTNFQIVIVSKTKGDKPMFEAMAEKPKSKWRAVLVVVALVLVVVTVLLTRNQSNDKASVPATTTTASSTQQRRKGGGVEASIIASTPSPVFISFGLTK